MAFVDERGEVMPDITELTDDAICAVIGQRLKTERLRLNLTQAEMARQAGISLRTCKRFESTGVSTVPTLVAILRALNRLRMLEVSLPGPTRAHHVTLITKVEQLRQRARRARRAEPHRPPTPGAS